MGQSIDLIRYGGNAFLNTLRVTLTESSSLTRYVVADSNGKLYYSTSGSGGGTATSASYATYATTAGSATSASYSTTSSLPLKGIITASASNTTITFTRGDGSTFNVTVSQSGSVATSSYSLYAETASFVATASWALNSITASYINPNNVSLFQITTGSITASVNVDTNSLFLIRSGSTRYLNISSSGNTDLYSNLFIVRNFTTQQPVLIVSQSIVQIQTQSSLPTNPISAGSIYFTSSSMYVGLE